MRGRPHVNATPTEYQGVKFPSKSEAAYAQLLDTLITSRPREIKFWIHQPKVYVGGAGLSYRPDFLVVPFHDQVAEYFVEVKGRETDRWKEKKKLWVEFGPAELRIVRRKKDLIFEAMEVIPTGKQMPCSGCGPPLPR